MLREVQAPYAHGRTLPWRIPCETANGKAFRLRGQGMPQSGQSDKRGDLYAESQIRSAPESYRRTMPSSLEAFARSTGYQA